MEIRNAGVVWSGIHLWTRCPRSDLTAWGGEGGRIETAFTYTIGLSCHVASQVLIAFDRGGREAGILGGTRATGRGRIKRCRANLWI